MYLLKKENGEDCSKAWFLAPGVKKEDIEITAADKSLNIKMKENEFWEADSADLTTTLPIKNVIGHLSDGILAIEIQYDIPKKKLIKVTID